MKRNFAPEMRRLLASMAMAATAVATSVHLVGAGDDDRYLSDKARLAEIRRALVWVKTDVGSMNMRTGPEGPGAFAPDEAVNCTYIEKTQGGNTPKFECAIATGDEVKIKYGATNGEVYAEVAATRLFWALGFGADRMYAVRVSCRLCPPDPKKDSRPGSGETLFDPAAIERRMRGHPLESSRDSGWAWPELDLVSEAEGGAPLAHRDALKLLAVMIQHTDSKRAQQLLVCLDEKAPYGHPCEHPFMMVSDLGVTFGHAHKRNTDHEGSVNFEKWSREPVWKDASKCVGNLTKSFTGTLDNPRISEAGRSFLAGLLAQLSDAQLRDLFDVARFPMRKFNNEDEDKRGHGSLEDWVSAFKQKREEIARQTCPS